GVGVARCSAFAHGGEGAMDLAKLVVAKLDAGPAPAPRELYALDAPYPDKLRAIARTAFGADDVVITTHGQKDLDRIAKTHPNLPVCVAKTHLSLSDDPKRHGRPRDFHVTVREARLLAGAGFVTALTGEILTMPGLPREPAANRVRIDETGRVRGLMQN